MPDQSNWKPGDSFYTRMRSKAVGRKKMFPRPNRNAPPLPEEGEQPIIQPTEQPIEQNLALTVVANQPTAEATPQQHTPTPVAPTPPTDQDQGQSSVGAGGGNKKRDLGKRFVRAVHSIVKGKLLCIHRTRNFRLGTQRSRSW